MLIHCQNQLSRENGENALLIFNSLLGQACRKSDFVWRNLKLLGQQMAVSAKRWVCARRWRQGTNVGNLEPTSGSKVDKKADVANANFRRWFSKKLVDGSWSVRV